MKNLIIKNVLYRGKNRRRIVLRKHWSAIKFVCQKLEIVFSFCHCEIWDCYRGTEIPMTVICRLILFITCSPVFTRMDHDIQGGVWGEGKCFQYFQFG